ncbi:MAG: hypothetical protein ACK521_05305 [bacterium]
MIVKVLTTKKEHRTNEDLKKLSPLIKDIPFFKERRIEGPMLLDVVGCMELKSV